MILPLKDWFRERGWSVFAYQQNTWDAYQTGAEGLIVAPTGMGKTYAALFGPMLAAAKDEPRPTILWITPLRALANDLALAIQAPLSDMKTGWTVDVRTGDTSGSRKARQRSNMPNILVTTPESLSLLLTYPDSAMQLRHLNAVIIDEWHELIGNKRGSLLELCLARLRSLAPIVRLWGISATIANPEEACRVLIHSRNRGQNGLVIGSDLQKPFFIDSIIPSEIERFPWSGHLGLKLLPEVLRAVVQAKTALLFTNVRSQAESWFAAIKDAMPELDVVVHHGSLDRTIRADAEAKIKSGQARLAVCTSSLDLGVDFPAVDLVIQVGSPKGIARMLQRLGRSGHSPFAQSRMLCVPTNAFELIEFSAARRGCERRDVEPRNALVKPLDVLVQHIVSCSLIGFEAELLQKEVRSSYAFATLSEAEWRWALEFASSGGPSLRAYGQFQRIARQEERYIIATPRLAKFHRMSIGTITADSMATVKYVRGGSLGNVEESFLARLKPGDKFAFAGKLLTLVQFRDMKAFVKKASPGPAIVPRWLGGRLPLSTHLASAVLSEFSRSPRSVELEAAEPILRKQAEVSAVPDSETLLVETVRLRSGFHLFLYPFAGFKVHDGLAAIVAYRLSRMLPLSISSIVNDYGFQILASAAFEVNTPLIRELLSPERLEEDTLQALNAAELARRQFREIARVAGLIFQGYPGAAKSVKQLQVSSGLLYDVFTKYDQENLLLKQASREALNEQLEYNRLAECLNKIAHLPVILSPLSALSPFAFPLWASFTRTQLSSEAWQDKVEKMISDLERRGGTHGKGNSVRG